MFEQRPPWLIALKEEHDESNLPDSQPAFDSKTLMCRLAEEIGRTFPGIHHSDVLKQAHSTTGDLSGAQDVAQDLYLVLLQLPEAQRPAANDLDTYISTSIRNLALKWRRRHRLLKHYPLEADFAEDVVEDFTDLVADEDEINFMLHQIPADCREIFIQFIAEDRTAQEVAELNGIKVEAVKKRLQRAVLKLAEARRIFNSEEVCSNANNSSDTTQFSSMESQNGKH